MDKVGVVLVHDFGLEGATVEDELREELDEEEGLREFAVVGGGGGE